MTIDVVIPVHNERENVGPFLQYVRTVLCPHFERVRAIVVDDGSTDGTFEIISQCAQDADPGFSVLGIKLARNFGKDMAIKCGLDRSDSDVCAIIDGDFQHPAEKILEACRVLASGYDVVHVERLGAAEESIRRKLGTKIFHFMLRYLAGAPIHGSDYKVMSKKAVAALKRFQESNYFNRGIVENMGMRAAVIHYVPSPRKSGKSSYSMYKLMRLTIDGVTCVSNRPLRLSFYLGTVVSLGSVLYAGYIALQKLLWGIPIPGFASLAVGIFFLGGVQLVSLGVIGEYVGRTYLEAKRRPQYVIDEEVTSRR
jgi:glycosyltransferase involved in cell wall biosynthesis